MSHTSSFSVYSRSLRDTRPRPKADRLTQPPPSRPPEPPRDKPPPREDFTREKPLPRDEFARNMLPPASTRLFNPHYDSIPVRRKESEAPSDHGSVSPPKSTVTRPQQRHDPSASRRLFDPKRDPVPVRLTVMNRNGEAAKPTPSHRSSGDYVSASSTSMSSYPPSLGSSAFTLTSASSSSSSAPFSKGKEDPNSPVVSQLKRLYREISHAERRLLADKQDPTDEPARVVVQSRDNPVPEDLDPWTRLISEHKECVSIVIWRFCFKFTPSQTRRAHAQLPHAHALSPSSCFLPQLSHFLQHPISPLERLPSYPRNPPPRLPLLPPRPRAPFRPHILRLRLLRWPAREPHPRIVLRWLARSTWRPSAVPNGRCSTHRERAIWGA